MSHCSKPGCAGPAAAILSYEYASSMVTLDDPGESVIDPHVYVLCAGCADKLMPPRGWTLQDRRQKPPLFLERDPRTVTVDVVDVIGDEASVPEPAPQHSRQLFFGHSA